MLSNVITMIRGDALEPTNGHRVFLNTTTPACRLAGAITDAPEDAGKYIGFAILHVGSGEIALRDHSDIGRNISVCRTAPLTVDDFVKILRVRRICWLHSAMHTGQFTLQ